MPIKTKLGNEINYHFEQTPQEVEVADQRADLYRKYEDVYSPSYTTPEARKYRIRKIINKLEATWGPTPKYEHKISAKSKKNLKEILEKLRKDWS